MMRFLGQGRRRGRRVGGQQQCGGRGTGLISTGKGLPFPLTPEYGDSRPLHRCAGALTASPYPGVSRRMPEPAAERNAPPPIGQVTSRPALSRCPPPAISGIVLPAVRGKRGAPVLRPHEGRTTER